MRIKNLIITFSIFLTCLFVHLNIAYSLAPLSDFKNKSLEILSPTDGINRLIEIIQEIVSKSHDVTGIEIWIDGAAYGIGKSTFIEHMVKSFILPIGCTIVRNDPGKKNIERSNLPNGMKPKFVILVSQGSEFIGSDQFIMQHTEQNPITIGIYLSDTDKIIELPERVKHADIIIDYRQHIRLTVDEMVALWKARITNTST
jgi:hypothetical protein